MRLHGFDFFKILLSSRALKNLRPELFTHRFFYRAFFQDRCIDSDLTLRSNTFISQVSNCTRDSSRSRSVNRALVRVHKLAFEFSDLPYRDGKQPVRVNPKEPIMPATSPTQDFASLLTFVGRDAVVAVFAVMAFVTLVSPAFAQDALVDRSTMNTHGNSMMDSGNEMMEQADTASGFAFFELFTSEGCSSCPAADTNLARLAAEATNSGQNVYTLSYHVDYWNRLGWTDPYSDAAFSQRQRAYAQHFESDRVYTPQMVINGAAEFVGSNVETSDRATNLAIEQVVNSAISVVAATGHNVVDVQWESTGLQQGDVINVALVQDSGRQQVTRGENARRDLSHVNIVRNLRTINEPAAAGSTQVAIPSDFELAGFHVVAFVQSSSNRIRAAGRSRINAMQHEATHGTEMHSMENHDMHHESMTHSDRIMDDAKMSEKRR